MSRRVKRLEWEKKGWIVAILGRGVAFGGVEGDDGPVSSTRQDRGETACGDTCASKLSVSGSKWPVP